MNILTTFVFCIMLTFRLSSANYEACGGHDVNDISTELENNIEDHVNRLMELKRPDHGWLNTPEVALSIQLSEPTSFSARNETLLQMRDELNEKLNITSLGSLSQYILALESMCQDSSNFNGLDLTSALNKMLKNEFHYNGLPHKSPRNGWYGFFLGMGACCVTHDHPVKPFYIRRCLHEQNEDGSFGHHSTDMTSQALLSLKCLDRKNLLPPYLQRQARKAMKGASQFLRSRVATERNLVWIDNKYSSPAAVMAIKEHSNWAEDAWRCNLIMKSLNQQSHQNEHESAISQRLMALAGVSFLSLLDDSYECVTLGDATESYLPSHVSSDVSCSDVEYNAISDKYYSPILIDVLISVYMLPPSTNDVTPDLDVTVTNIQKGKTLSEILKIAQCRGMLTFGTDLTSWGEMITEVEGIEARKDYQEYWNIKNNGNDLNVGIGQFWPSDSDHIELILKKW